MKLMMKVIAITGAAIMAPVGILKLTLQILEDKLEDQIVEAVLIGTRILVRICLETLFDIMQHYKFAHNVNWTIYQFVL